MDETREERFARQQREMREAHLGRQGLVRHGEMTVREALVLMRETLPTLAHAARFFAAAVDRLGDRGHADAESRRGRRQLYVRDTERPGWVFAHPILELYVGTAPPVVMVGAAPPPRPALDIVPRGEWAVPGELHIREGAAEQVIRYDERGVFLDASTTGGDSFTFLHRPKEDPFTSDPLARPPVPPPPSVLVAPDLAQARGSPERFAAGIDADRHVAHVGARALIPAPIPDGIDFAWMRTRGVMARVLREEPIGEEARWLVCDGFDGVAFASAATFDAAVEAWRAEVFRKKPRPPYAVKLQPEPGEGPRVEQVEPPAPPERNDEKGTTTLSLGTFSFSIPAPVATMDWPPATPRNIPAIAIPLSPLPAVPERFAAAGYARWVRFLGARGQVTHMLCRDEPDGTSFVGEHVVDIVDPRTIAGEIDAAEAEHFEGHPLDPREECRYWLQQYAVWDDLRRERCAPAAKAGAGVSDAPPLGQIDADLAAWHVARIRERKT